MLCLMAFFCARGEVVVGLALQAVDLRVRVVERVRDLLGELGVGRLHQRLERLVERLRAVEVGDERGDVELRVALLLARDLRLLDLVDQLGDAGDHDLGGHLGVLHQLVQALGVLHEARRRASPCGRRSSRPSTACARSGGSRSTSGRRPSSGSRPRARRSCRRARGTGPPAARCSRSRGARRRRPSGRPPRRRRRSRPADPASPSRAGPSGRGRRRPPRPSRVAARRDRSRRCRP